MVQRLDARDPSFNKIFEIFLSAKREVSDNVDDTVRAIIEDVRMRGDAALIDYTQRFDGLSLTQDTVRVTKSDIRDAVKRCPPEELSALKAAHARIAVYHAAQKPQDQLTTDDAGVTLGWRWTALESVGIYVPGGTASYPSSVLMNAAPAKVAGVPRIVMAVPMPKGEINPLVLAAADLAGVDEIIRVGGAQAVAALAYGTQSLKSVVKIVGPGNAYVAAAKRRVFGHVGIDMIAGPSEVLVIADKDANPDWIAADLLAQAEHDTAAQSILLTDDESLALAVEKSLEAQLTTLPREKIARASWEEFGAIIMVDDVSEAAAIVDRIAPEHLEIATRNPEALVATIRNAGSIFLGAHTPEAIGDYVGGPNHVLPTARSARFASGLGVLDFMKRTSILKCDRAALAALGPVAVTLGRSEGLEAHARSVVIRFNRPI